MHKNTPLCWVHSKEMLQQFCAVSSGRKKAKGRKSIFKCGRRNNEASSQQLLRLPNWTQIEHEEPIIVGFFILQYAKLRKLELYYNFFARFCDVNKFEELEMDTDTLDLVLAEKELEDCIGPEMRSEWQRLRSNDCVDNVAADAVANFFPRTCCVKQHDTREPGLFKEEFRCTEMLILCGKTYCCYDVTSNKLKLSSKCLNKRVLEQSGDGHLKRIGESWTKR